AWWGELPGSLAVSRVVTPPERLGAVTTPVDADATVFAWVVDGARDASVRFAAQALELGLAVHFADKPFSAEGREFVRGSLLVRRHENDQRHTDLAARVERAA